MTGFTGSGGTAIVTEKEALLWVDDRYHNYAQAQLDSNWTLMKSGSPGTPSLSEWLNANLRMGSRVGINAKLMPFKTWLQLKEDLEPNNHNLVPVGTDLIDLIWDERAAPPESVIQPMALEHTGKVSKCKMEEVRAEMDEKGADMLIITALDDISWLFNLRGSDIPYSTVFISFAILLNHQIHLFIDEQKITLDVRNHFNKEDIPVNLHSYESITSFVPIQIASHPSLRKVWVASPCNFELFSLVPERQRITDMCPIALMKAIKNEAEIRGMVNAHIKDSIAVCRYLAWLEKEISSGRVTESFSALKLHHYRREEDSYIGPSILPASASGANSGQIRYKLTPFNTRNLTCKELYLCDSGGHYRDGTTEITRTIHFGQPSEFEKECFTRVFKGQTALATTIFPSNTKGHCLEAIAKKPLWEIGLDYVHSTGHAIGAFLHAHEGPMGIGNKHYPDDPGLQLNMLVTNGPGYYKNGEIGLQLKNVMQVVEAKTCHNYEDKMYLTFNPLTLVPIQTKLLIHSALSKDEVSTDL
ncbi:hypothetical protein AAG570_012998 [Ranatra chinensis]|uniref:Uncharacterized protein n=1 Tax=Ranatra chinensis TaxID=642074 RepID=A0ABD0YFI7_9HEMI